MLLVVLSSGMFLRIWKWLQPFLEATDVVDDLRVEHFHGGNQLFGSLPTFVDIA
jgi:hypothetical protein